MTDLPGEADDQRAANDPDPVAGPPNPTQSAWGTSGHVPPDSAPPAPGPAPAMPGFVAGSPTSGSPGYGPPSGYQPPYPPPEAPPGRAGGSKTGLVVGVVVGLVAVLGVGVAIGLSAGGGSSTEAVPASIPASPSQVPTTTTTTAPPSAPPGMYSMSAIANACDLLDPGPLMKWSSTPAPPVHREDPPSGGYGGAMTCSLNYTSTSPVDGVTTDQAGIGVRVEFTSAGEPPAYDEWNRTGAAQKGWSTGTIPGLGARNNWRGSAVTDPSPGASYFVGVQDGNVSVEVQVAVLRARGEGPLNLDDLSAIAQPQVRTVLDRLRHP